MVGDGGWSTLAATLKDDMLGIRLDNVFAEKRLC